MNNKAGIHLQKNEDLEGLLALGCQTYLGMQNNLDTLSAIRQRQSNATLSLRYYDKDTMQQSPLQRAREHFNYLTANHNGIVPYQLIDIFSPFNEQNLAHEHPSDQRILPHPSPKERAKGTLYSWWETDDGYLEQGIWAIEYIEEFKRLCKQNGISIPLGGPALSPGHDVYLGSVSEGPESEYKVLAESLKLWDYWFIHCYGNPSDKWTGGRWHLSTQAMEDAAVDRRPAYITEYNGGHFAQLLSDIAPEMSFYAPRGACWFLWASHDSNFQLMQFKNMPEQIAALKAYTASVSQEGKVAEYKKPGFGDYVDLIGRDVIGEPARDEFYVGTDIVFQPTSKGLLVWCKASSAGAQFFPSNPKA